MKLYHGLYIAVEQAIGQLRYAAPTHQMCICNQDIADKYLHYVGINLI